MKDVKVGTYPVLFTGTPRSVELRDVESTKVIEMTPVVEVVAGFIELSLRYPLNEAGYKEGRIVILNMDKDVIAAYRMMCLAQGIPYVDDKVVVGIAAVCITGKDQGLDQIVGVKRLQECLQALPPALPNLLRTLMGNKVSFNVKAVADEIAAGRLELTDELRNMGFDGWHKMQERRVKMLNKISPHVAAFAVRGTPEVHSLGCPCLRNIVEAAVSTFQMGFDDPALQLGMGFYTHIQAGRSFHRTFKMNWFRGTASAAWNAAALVQQYMEGVDRNQLAAEIQKLSDGWKEQAIVRVF